MSTSPELKWLHIDEAAERFKVTTRTLYRHIKQGKHPTEKRYGRLFVGIPVSSAESGLSQLSVTATNENVSQASQMSDNTDALNVANVTDVGAEAAGIGDEEIDIKANENRLRDERDALHGEVEQLRTGLQCSQTQLSESLASANALNKQNESLVHELSEFRQQVEASRLRSDSIIMKLTQQLEQSNLQLEDLRQKKTVWQRVKSVFVTEAA